MKPEKYDIEFITPCFCAGADQAHAEVRAPSIRGQLHWWFRALGGTKEQEGEIFGSVDNELGQSSSLMVRVMMVSNGKPWSPPRVDPNSDSAYVFYFASVSGKVKGQRWTNQGNIPPGSKFCLFLNWRRGVSANSKGLFNEALEAYLHFGGLGMRTTRGLGAIVCEQRPVTPVTLNHASEIIKRHGFKYVEYQTGILSWDNAIYLAGGVLKRELRGKFKAGKKGDQPSPLGTSNPRQTSAVYLRPVRMVDNTYSLVLFEAPKNRVLGLKSQGGAPVLQMYEHL